MMNLGQSLSSSICLSLLLVCVLICWTGATDDDNHRVVETELGKVRGLKRISVLNKYVFYAFKGIYYAKNPSGKLRFKAPEPIEPWAPTTYDAFEHTPTCIRPIIQPFVDDAPQSENCLSLNIFVPDGASPTNKKPVLFHIHGGGYNIMSGDEHTLGPDYLIEEDIVIVTLNYRLGVLGFLSLNTPEYSGNMGLKDQQMALKFVYDHIGNFGGDNQQITINGMSAGAASAHFHILSKDSRKYIKRAYLMSGSVNNYWAMSDENDHTDFAFKMAAEIGQPRTSIRGLVDFLTTAPDDKFRTIGILASTFFNTWFFKMAPVIERLDAIRPFLLKDPFELYKDEPIDTDIMFSTTNMELVSFYNAYPVLYPKRLQKMHKNFTLTLPFRNLKFSTESDEYYELLQDVRDFYFGDKRVGTKTHIEYIKMLSDLNFDYPNYISIKRHIQESTGKVYALRFSVNATLNMVKRYFSDRSEYAGHSDDNCYIFTCNGPYPYYKDMLNSLNHEDERISLRTIATMAKIVSNYVKYGNPTYNDELIAGNRPVKCFDINIIEITNNGLELSLNPRKKEVEFWEDLERKAEKLGIERLRYK